MTSPAGAKYIVKGNCYRRALREASGRGTAVALLNADVVLADGFVRTTMDLLYDGVRVIEVAGPRGLRDPIGHALRSRYSEASGVSIKINPIELSALWFRRIHPLLAMHFVDGPEGEPFHPSHLYWRVGNDGVIARCFHLYPIVVWPRDTSANFRTTIDDDLVSNLRFSQREVFVADDSRKMFCCELSPPEQYVGHMARRGDFDSYVAFYGSYNKRNIHNLRREIIVSGVRDLDSRWDVRRMESAQFTRRLIRECLLARRRQRPRGLWGRGIGLVRRLTPGPVKAVLRRARAILTGSKPEKMLRTASNVAKRAPNSRRGGQP